MSIKMISVKDVVKKILQDERLYILDVRPKESFDDWKVEGKSVEVINSPSNELLGKIDTVMEKVPKGENLYVICAKGKSSLKAVEKIVQEGYNNIYSIDGGMRAWSEHLEPIKVGDLKNGGVLYQFVRIGKGCLSYFIISNGKGAIIDTNRMLEPYEEFLTNHSIELTHVFDTHLHADHISGGRRIAEKLGATYYLPPKDAGEVTFQHQPIEDSNEMIVGHSTIKAIYSPGHTIGSTSFIVDDQYLMTGDILFVDSIGRPDLAGKAEDWVGDLRNTLYKRYKELADDLLVLPAHYMGIKEMNDDGSVFEKLGVLYKENHGLNIHDETEFRKAVTDNLPPQPNSYEEIRLLNMGKLNRQEEEQSEMEIGPNRCAIR
ncbi:MBL fold metallo-hydrolase [Litchfieldia salsa]|uniref:Glyoxylase, beta-lactamase superfamily II n=1 Tax=Litchfieldia salsa TaxID=930152 RepID=A0A1H0T3B7_9BACI|nr:MBL fold metallo-hydrolase [Litchfieldia salsa]SDP48479.1 Glyoxylase, beta-lactamase superfamily II [Litchfieldia salsa]